MGKFRVGKRNTSMRCSCALTVPSYNQGTGYLCFVVLEGVPVSHWHLCAEVTVVWPLNDASTDTQQPCYGASDQPRGRAVKWMEVYVGCENGEVPNAIRWLTCCQLQVGTVLREPLLLQLIDLRPSPARSGKTRKPTGDNWT